MDIDKVKNRVTFIGDIEIGRLLGMGHISVLCSKAELSILEGKDSD